MSTIQPATSSFTPRKEFLRIPKHTRNTFALLAFSGANCVRLHSFSENAVHAVRRVLEQFAPILAVCEDAPNSLCEFTIDKKPWANSRSVPSEKLLVDILRAIYHSGHTYMSTMDYGREVDDRLVMIFSKTEQVAPSLSRPQNPNLVSRDESSTSSLGENLPIKQIPFAISFSSMTVMRVISPPLHLTPAILQACRGAWPRGVVSEKTVHGNSYEFKLKGYGLFEQDTFAADSLQHILTLLSSLDSQSFSLIASISLTNHSRSKDLWLFTAPASDDTTSDILEPPTSESPLRRYSFPPGQVDSQHKEATDLSPDVPLTGYHNKSSSEGSQRRALPANVLRKATPRVQVPVDFRNSELLSQDGHTPGRTHLPSVVPAGAVDMTGVGSGQTPDVLYETLPLSLTSSTRPAPEPLILQRAGSSSPPRSPGISPPHLTSSSSIGSKGLGSHITEKGTLLGSMAFRDSSMTSDTDLTREIPIKWTGSLTEGDKPKARESRIAEARAIIPGWEGPIAEQDEERRETAILENGSRVEAPEIVQPNVELRKSEAALVGLIKSTTTPVPKDSASGKGWVLVNVEDSPSSRPASNGDSVAPERPKPASPEAKAIAVMDLLSSEAGDSSVKRLFSLGRKNSARLRNADK